MGARVTGARMCSRMTLLTEPVDPASRATAINQAFCGPNLRIHLMGGRMANRGLQSLQRSLV